MEGGVHVLFDEKNGDAPAAKLADGTENGLDNQRGEPQGRFVEQEELRLGHEPPSYGKHLLFPAAHRSCLLGKAFLEFGEEDKHGFKKVVEALLLCRVDVGAEEKVLFDRKGAEDLASLGDMAEPDPHELVGLAARHVLRIKGERTRRRGYYPGQDLKKGRFSGPVGPHETDDLALVHLQVYCLEDLYAGISG
ncbi:MAG: hypothetical protein A4E60_03417 [Syntrophorhabdus sp. PtaB.Bin047]|nr:MAG: hypothetical protein A4E60_03417 [Syntrophorhabdus sp. PtaB.Bin047]